jgi:hypothetical protein
VTTALATRPDPLLDRPRIDGTYLAPPPTSTPSTPHDLIAWAEQVRAASEIASAFWGSAFIPAQLIVYLPGKERQVDHEATIANATAAIVTGFAVGFDPLASLRSVDVIQGTPAFRAVALRAVAQSHGHETWIVESNSTRCVMSGKRKGSAHTETVTWDLDRAAKMGLAGKDQWRKQPGAMLVARATAEVVRLIAADAILGVPYAAEELGDGDAPDVLAEYAATAPAKRTAKRAARPTPTPAEEAFTAEPDPVVAEARASVALDHDEHEGTRSADPGPPEQTVAERVAEQVSTVPELALDADGLLAVLPTMTDLDTLRVLYTAWRSNVAVRSAIKARGDAVRAALTPVELVIDAFDAEIVP